MRPAVVRGFMLLLAALGLFATWPIHAEQGPAVRPATSDVPVEDPDGARVIVKYKSLGRLMRGLRAGTWRPIGPRFAAAMSYRHGLALRDGRIVEGRTQVLHGDKSIGSAALAARLAADDEVEYAVADYRRFALAAPTDPLYAASSSISPAAGQWYLRKPDSTFVSAIDAPAAWAVTTGSSAVVVADVDTGVRFDHPDLVDKLLAGYDFVTGSSAAGDGNGRDADASDAGDWAAAGECGIGSAATSSSWHGTKTAGLIGARTDNAIGMASIGRDVMVLPARALGKCGGSDSDIIAAMLWAGGVSSVPVPNPQPARVINLSLGGSGSCSAAYVDAISQLTAAGVVVVVAAGNSEGQAVSTPGNCAGVITVAAVRHAGTKVGFSSIGPEVAIAAPGGNCVDTAGPCRYPILTTTNAGTTTPSTSTYTTSSNYSVGTSFATPLVAGTAALMLSANPSLTPAQVRDLIRSSARPFPSSSTDPTVTQCRAPGVAVQDECLCTTATCGAGLLDAGAAVSAAAASAVPVARISSSATTVYAGNRVTFDASGSILPAGRTIASYRWSIASGGAIATIGGATNAATLTVDATGIGSFTVALTLTDSTGASASASSTVSVNAPSGPAVQIQASADVVEAGSSVGFDASGSTVASGLTLRSYQWSIVSGASIAHFTSATDGPTATLATDGAGSGSVVVRLAVTDSLGQTSSLERRVAVTPVVPTAVVVASATTVAVGASVALDGSASRAVPGRTIAACRWSIASGASIAAFSGATDQCTSAVVATLAAGGFSAVLTVTDSAGAQATASVAITVEATAAASGAGSSASGGSSTGGGASGGLGLVALAAAAGLLARRRADRA